MKVSKLYLYVMSALLLVSCGSKTSDSSEADDSAAREQVIADSIAAADAKWKADSLERCNMRSLDLTFFELHGPVKTMNDGYCTYKFSEEGQLMTVDGRNPFKGDPYSDNAFDGRKYFKRDSKGRISKEDAWESHIEYKWNEDKLVGDEWAAEAMSGKTTYTVDEQGIIIAAKGYEEEFGESRSSVSCKFSIDKRDEYGNWLRKSQKGATSKRTITYYPIVRPGTAKASTGGIDPSLEYVFTGKIGDSPDSRVQFGPDGGNYVINHGERDLRFKSYDPATSELVLTSYYKGSTTKIGEFVGTYRNGTYKGIFTNINNGGRVDFVLEEN